MIDYELEERICKNKNDKMKNMEKKQAEAYRKKESHAGTSVAVRVHASLVTEASFSKKNGSRGGLCY